uniref:Ig-like domain-containing protein n=1 Tax=Parastrongyloides trichosuri TaxID=131310 RepID=A0A0N4Z4F6_PARTI
MMMIFDIPFILLLTIFNVHLQAQLTNYVKKVNGHLIIQTGTGVKKENIENMDITNLENFQGAFYDLGAIEISTTKLLNIDWTKYRQKMTTDKINGFTIEIESDESIYATIPYYEKNNMQFKTFDNPLYDIMCNPIQCNIGLIMFSRDLKDRDLLFSKNYLKVNKAMIILIKSEDNKLEFNKINKVYDLVICPVSKWVPTKSQVQYEPNRVLNKSGVTIYNNNRLHTILPIFFKKGESNFFLCGKLRQPSLPDLDVGYSVVPPANEGENKLQNNSDIDITQTISEKCSSSKNDSSISYYTFVYSDEKSNFNNDIDIIWAQELQTYPLASGDIVLFYKKPKVTLDFTDDIKYIKLLHNYKPSCSKKVKNIEVIALISHYEISSFKSEVQNNKYYQIKSDQNVQMECYAFAKNSAVQTNFYSNSIEFNVVKKHEESEETIGSKFMFEISNIAHYGSYMCGINNAVENVEKTLIKSDYRVLIPKADSELKLEEILLRKEGPQHPYCKRSHFEHDKIIEMDVSYGENKKFSTTNFQQPPKEFIVSDKIIEYNNTVEDMKYLVVCTYGYGTILRIKFKTIQEFRFSDEWLNEEIYTTTSTTPGPSTTTTMKYDHDDEYEKHQPHPSVYEPYGQPDPHYPSPIRNKPKEDPGNTILYMILFIIVLVILIVGGIYAYVNYYKKKKRKKRNAEESSSSVSDNIGDVPKSRHSKK